MVKKVSLLLVFLMLSAAAFSNVVISSKHKDKMKDGKTVNCLYCHAGEMKIEKKKGQIKDKKIFNGVSLAKIKSCNGAGCHK